jgi:hypothetical protein
LENDRAKVYYDVPVLTRNVRAMKNPDGTDRYTGVRHDRPDLVVFDKIKSRIRIVEVCVCWHENLENQELIKYHKYSTNSEVEDELSLVDPKTRTAGYNLRGLMGEMYGNTYPNGVSVVPIVFGACGEVKPNIKERFKELGIASNRQFLKTLEACQVAVIHGSGRLIRAHLCGSN